jgi:uncharacterized protein YegP (UPF0339 family)
MRFKITILEQILANEGYTMKANCRNGISSVKTNVPYNSNYNRLTARNDKHYFNLKSAHNGQVIGTSEMYESKQGRDNGIESVKLNAPLADVVDLTETVYS